MPGVLRFPQGSYVDALQRSGKECKCVSATELYRERRVLDDDDE